MVLPALVGGELHGADGDGHAVLSAANAVPKLGWFVLFEQPTAQALTPIRDQLLRVALEEFHKRIPEYSLKPGHEELEYPVGFRSVKDLMLVWPH